MYERLTKRNCVKWKERGNNGIQEKIPKGRENRGRVRKDD